MPPLPPRGRNTSEPYSLRSPASFSSRHLPCRKPGRASHSARSPLRKAGPPCPSAPPAPVIGSSGGAEAGRSAWVSLACRFMSALVGFSGSRSLAPSAAPLVAASRRAIRLRFLVQPAFRRPTCRRTDVTTSRGSSASFATRRSLTLERSLDSVHSRQRRSISRSTRLPAESDTQASRANILSLASHEGGLISSASVLPQARASAAAAAPRAALAALLRAARTHSLGGTG